jgi:hypothetical protein
MVVMVVVEDKEKVGQSREGHHSRPVGAGACTGTKKFECRTTKWRVAG